MAKSQAALREAKEIYSAKAGSTRYPQVEANIYNQRQRFSPSASGRDGDATEFSLYNASVGVQYNLDLVGGNRRALEALSANVELTRQEWLALDDDAQALTDKIISRRAYGPILGRHPLGEPEWVTTGTRRWSSPDPSPDGRTVALYSLTQPDGDIFVIHADGTGLRQITADSAADRVPRWSPDGSWLAFFSGRDSDLRPWKIRPDGSDLTRLGDRGSVVVWSPLGDRIAVATGLPGASAILDPNVPWTDQAYDTIPAPEGSRFVPNDWSPDGARIAGSAGFGDAGILVYHVAERSLTRLTDFGQWPVWLPDGRKILFVSGGNGFYVVDRGTRQVRRVYEVERDVIGPPRLTRDGRTAYFTRRVTEADIWMVTLH